MSELKINKNLIILIIWIIFTIILTYMALIYTPLYQKDWSAPYAQKIFYFHVPAAWVSYLAFFVVFAASIVFIKTNSRKWDIVALCSAEIGVIFCTLAIVSGPVWGKAEWGKFWRWEDTKLFMTLVLWLIYISYVALRSASTSSDQGARIAAVFGILGFVCVPLSFFANRLWKSLHPTIIGTSEGSMQPIVGQALLVGVITFTLFYIYLLFKRIQLEKLGLRIEELKEVIGGE
jgi:heme exporter protein C